MRKDIYLIALALCASVCACQPEQSELKISSIKEKATIVGTVEYDEGYSSDGSIAKTWVPASNVTVIAKISYSQYLDRTSSGFYSVKATTGADGKYSLEVPVGERSLAVNVSCLPFNKNKYAWDYVDGKRITIGNALYNQSSTVTVTAFSGNVSTANISVTSLE